MNVEIGTEAAHFPEKKYINGISFAVYCSFKKGTRIEEKAASQVKGLGSYVDS
jgi:hypothetical protein